MKYVLFPFFLLRLGLGVGVFLIKIALIGFRWSASLLLASGLLIFQLLFFLDQTWSLRKNIYRAALQAIYHDQYQQRLIYLQQRWETILEKQPGHRDVLINLSLISGELGSREKQLNYQQKASRVDPNYQNKN